MKSWVEQRNGYDADEVAARQAEITGKPPRIEPIGNDALSGTAKDLIARIRGSIGAAAGAIVPEYFRTMVKHPELFRCQLEMGTALFRGKLPARERELAVLRVGWLMRAPYEWGEHVDLGLRYGLTREEIERVRHGSNAPGWNAHDGAILRAVEELLSDQAISDNTWATLASSWNEQQLIEFPMIVGQYVANAFVQNALRMRLAADNPGLTYAGRPSENPGAASVPAPVR